MTPQQDDNAWRRHEVPTYTQAQDTWLFGLSFRQLIAIAIGAGVGYAVYQMLFFLDIWFRIGIGVVVVLISAAFVALKPGGRSLFSVLYELISFQFRTKHYTDLTRHVVASNPTDQFRPQRRRKTLNIPIPTPSNTVYIRLRLPIGGRRDSAEAVIIALVGSAVLLSGIACSVQAQETEHYIGKRIYLESVVMKYRDYPVSAEVNTATVRMKSAAPLRWSQPRLLESLQSVTERRAQATTVRPARRQGAGLYGGGDIPPIYGIAESDGFAFENVRLDDTRQIRPYCDVPLENGQLLTRSGGDAYYFRHHTNRCRMLQPTDLAFIGDEGVGQEYSVSRPTMTVQWEDIKRNKGALRLHGPLMPYPGPSLYDLNQILIDTDSELLNPGQLCDPREISVLSLGLQTVRPANPGTVDYFDGRSGRLIGGEVKVCRLENPNRVANIGLKETVVFAQGHADYEIKVRPIVTTLLPDNIVNRAVVRVYDVEGGGSQLGPDFIVPKQADADYDPAKPNIVKFIVPAGVMMGKDNLGELDKGKIQIELEVHHAVTVKRPVYQPIQEFAEFGDTHIWQCVCSCSGGGCSASCNSRRCNRNSDERTRYYKYWDPHERVDDMDRAYLPTDPSSDVVLLFTQTFTFESIEVSFDKFFQTLVYVEPTPRAGRQRQPDYYNQDDDLGYIGGFLGGEALTCGPDVATTASGEPTGWVWVVPGINSKGEAYGGCRRDFLCKLLVPPQEEIFGAGGLPTEEDYECVEYDYDSE